MDRRPAPGVGVVHKTHAFSSWWCAIQLQRVFSGHPMTLDLTRLCRGYCLATCSRCGCAPSTCVYLGADIPDIPALHFLHCCHGWHALNSTHTAGLQIWNIDLCVTQPAELDPLANVQVQRRPLQRLPRPCRGAAAGGASIRAQCQPAAAAATARADPCANTCTHARAHPGADAYAHARPRGWRCGQT